MCLSMCLSLSLSPLIQPISVSRKVEPSVSDESEEKPKAAARAVRKSMTIILPDLAKSERLSSSSKSDGPESDRMEVDDDDSHMAVDDNDSHITVRKVVEEETENDMSDQDPPSPLRAEDTLKEAGSDEEAPTSSTGKCSFTISVLLCQCLSTPLIRYAAIPASSDSSYHWIRILPCLLNLHMFLFAPPLHEYIVGYV